MAHFNAVNGNVNHVNGNIAANDNDRPGWRSYYHATPSPSPPPSPVEQSDAVSVRRTLNSRQLHFIPAPNDARHPIIPDDLMTNDENAHRNFLDFPPLEVPSAEDHEARYFGVVKSIGPWQEKTAVVRTLDGCDVDCSTEGCEGLHRLRRHELCQIVHYRSGESAGMTFVSHTAAECTPLPSGAVTRVPSPAGSRRGSLAPSGAESSDEG